MSDQQPPPDAASPPSAGSPRKIWLAIALILSGVLLLLPGACSAFFFYFGIVTSVGVVGLLIGMAGLWMIGYGIRSLTRR